MDFHIKHRSASGALQQMWDYDPGRRCLIIVFRMANEREPVEIDVPVCQPMRPRFGAFPLLRKDGNTWVLVSERFVLMPSEADDGSVVRVLVPTPSTLHSRLTGGDRIRLCDSPPEINRELEAL